VTRSRLVAALFATLLLAAFPGCAPTTGDVSKPPMLAAKQTWRTESVGGTVTALQVLPEAVAAFSADGATAAVLDRNGRVTWRRSWPGWVLDAMSADASAAVTVISRRALRPVSGTAFAHVIEACGPRGDTLWETTVTIEGAEAVVDARVDRAGRLALLIPSYNGTAPADMPSSYQLRDARTGRVLFDAPPVWGMRTSRVDAPEDLSFQMVSSAGAPREGEEGLAAGMLRMYGNGKVVRDSSAASESVMAFVAMSGKRYLDARDQVRVTMRDTETGKAVWSGSVDYASDVRFSTDERRVLVSSLNTAQDPSGATTAMSGFRLLDAATGAAIWSFQTSGGGFYRGALDQAGRAIVLTADDPGSPPLVFRGVDNGASVEGRTLPVAAVAAAFVAGDRLVVGDAGGTLTLFELQ
jgi:hypothetical protein